MFYKGESPSLAPIPSFKPTGLSACWQAPPAVPAPSAGVILSPQAARSANYGTWRGHTHYSMIEAKTGGEVDADGWRDGIRRNEKLQKQSAALADALERRGIKARSDNDVTLVGLVTGEQRRLESYRPIRFLPTVAQRERKKYKNALEFLLTDTSEYSYVRFCVINEGLPIRAFGDLRKAHQERSRKISKFSSIADRVWGVEVILRATEYTREQRGDDKFFSYHLHNNVLLRPRWYSPKKWKKFLRWAKAYFNNGFGDNGKVRSVEEIVKYMIKPDSLDGICDYEVEWLYQETFKARFLAPMGSFREFMGMLHDDKLKVLRAPGRNKEKGRLTLVKKEYHPKRDAPDTDRPEGVSMNWLGTTTAMPAFSPFCEPCALVQNMGSRPAPGFDQVHGEWKAWAKSLWDEAGAPEPAAAVALGRALMAGDNVQSISKARQKKASASYRVHTYSVTVPDLPGGKEGDWSGGEETSLPAGSGVPEPPARGTPGNEISGTRRDERSSLRWCS